MIQPAEYIKGTEPGNMYRVLHKRGSAILAIRHLFEQIDDNTYGVGFRVRNQFHQVEGEPVPINKHEYLVGMYPLPYNSKGPSHLSATAAVKVTATYDDVKEVAEKILDMIIKSFDGMTLEEGEVEQMKKVIWDDMMEPSVETLNKHADVEELPETNILKLNKKLAE